MGATSKHKDPSSPEQWRLFWVDRYKATLRRHLMPGDTFDAYVGIVEALLKKYPAPKYVTIEQLTRFLAGADRLKLEAVGVFCRWVVKSGEHADFVREMLARAERSRRRAEVALTLRKRLRCELARLTKAGGAEGGASSGEASEGGAGQEFHQQDPEGVLFGGIGILEAAYAGDFAGLGRRDVDLKRMVLWARKAKGRKGRMVMLDSDPGPAIRSWLEHGCGRRYVFEGDTAGKAISRRTIQKVYTDTCARLGVDHQGGIHSLRHSFGTYLLEQGVNLRYIQELPGHSSSKTTEIYTHVAANKIRDIRSPIAGMLTGAAT